MNVNSSELYRPRTMHLFSGVGGGIYSDLLLGHRPICAVEINEHCQQVLSQRQKDNIFPWFPIFDDVKSFDGKPWRVKSERHTKEKDCFSLPTLTATDAKGRTYHYSRGCKTKPILSLVGVAKLLPTPAATDWKGQYTWETVKKRMCRPGVRLSEELCRRVGKAIIPNPEFWEWMMAWPIGSSGLKPVGMDKLHAWLRLHTSN